MKYSAGSRSLLLWAARWILCQTSSARSSAAHRCRWARSSELGQDFSHSLKTALNDTCVATVCPFGISQSDSSGIILCIWAERNQFERISHDVSWSSRSAGEQLLFSGSARNSSIYYHMQL